MPQIVEIPGVGEVEFPDSMTDDEVSKASQKLHRTNRLENERERGRTAKAWLGSIGAVEDALEPISLGGLGDIAGAAAADLLTGGSPQTFNLPALSAELAGDPMPEHVASDLQKSWIKSGLVGGARFLPTMAAATALGPLVGPVAAMGGAMGAETVGREGYGKEALKSAAMGAAIPVAGAVARTAAGAGTAALANRGLAAAASPAVQRTVEAVASQAAPQGILMADLMASEAYRNASPDERDFMMKEAMVQNGVFGIHDVAKAVNPALPTMASRFENPAIRTARALEGSEMTPRPEVEGTVQAPGRVERPSIVELPAQSMTPSPEAAAALADAQRRIVTPQTGQAMRTLEARLNPPDVITDASTARGDVQGGRVSFAAEAPTLTSNVPDQTADALRRETLPASTALVDRMARTAPGLNRQPLPVMKPGESTPGRTPIPESPAAIAEQIRLTADPQSTKAATLVTPGEAMPEVPENLATVRTKHGTVVFNPEKVDITDIRDAASGDVFDGRMLGQSGVASPGTHVVTTDTPAAKNVVTELVADAAPGQPDPMAVQVAAEAQQAAVPGGTTRLKPAIEVAKERQSTTQDVADRAEKQARDRLELPLPEGLQGSKWPNGVGVLYHATHTGAPDIQGKLSRHLFGFPRPSITFWKGAEQRFITDQKPVLYKIVALPEEIQPGADFSVKPGTELLAVPGEKVETVEGESVIVRTRVSRAASNQVSETPQPATPPQAPAGVVAPTPGGVVAPPVPTSNETTKPVLDSGPANEALGTVQGSPGGQAKPGLRPAGVRRERPKPRDDGGKPGAQPKPAAKGPNEEAQVQKEKVLKTTEGAPESAPPDPVVSWLESKIDPRLDEPGTRSGGLNPNVLIRAAIASHKAGKPFAEAVEDALKTGHSLYGAFDDGAARNRIVAGMAGVLRESNLQPGQKIRKFAERATVSPQLSDEAKLRVAADPTIVYDPQKVSTEANAASLKTDADLGSDWGNPESNTAVISGLELVNRALRTNQPDVAARNIAELAHRGTTLGQLVNQFKLLKGTLPEYTTFLADKHLQAAGYDPLTPVQRTQLTGLTAKSINAHKATESSDATYLGNRTPENWRKVSDAYRAEQEANAELNYQLARWRPRSMQDVLVAILQGNLMTPLSQTANVMGNAFKFGYEPSVRTGAAVLDAIESAVTGKPRTSTLRPIQGSVAKLLSLAEASKVAADIVRRGADTVHYEAGKKGGAALNAPRSWGDIIGWFRGQTDLPTRGGKVPPIDIAKRFLEGTFGIPADAMFRGLASMDVMFRVPERGRLIFDEAKRGGLSDEEAMRAVARPELFLPKDALARVDFESARTVYQQDNLATSSVGRVNDLLRRVPGLYLLSRTVVPFQKTPVNVMGELLTYTPFGMFKLWGDLGYPGARRYARQMGTDTAVNRREANFTASKMAFGSVAMAAGAWMFAKGVISPPLDAEDEAQKTRLGTADALPANHINLSGLQRAIKGQDATPRPGDDIRDLRRLGLVGGLLYMTSFALRQAEKKRADPSSTTADIVGSAPSTVTSWALNQTFLTGVSDFLDKLKGGSGETAMTAWAQGVSAFALPNTMQAINRAIRESKPEFRDDSALQQFGNRLNDKVNALGFTIPLGREVKALPLKVDLWGQPISETPPGKNPLIWHFFDITKSRTIPEDVVAVELYNLWRRTTDTAVFPSIPARLLTVEGQQSEPITYDQYQELATDVGKSRRYLVEKLVGGEVGFNGKNWQGLNDEERIEALTKLYEDGRKIGMNQFVKVLIESGQTLTPRKSRRGPVQVK